MPTKRNVSTKHQETICDLISLALLLPAKMSSSGTKATFSWRIPRPKSWLVNRDSITLRLLTVYFGCGRPPSWPLANEGVFFFGIPYKKCNHPGDHCYWDHSQDIVLVVYAFHYSRRSSNLTILLNPKLAILCCWSVASESQNHL